jgi:hypothetical protein
LKISIQVREQHESQFNTRFTEAVVSDYLQFILRPDRREGGQLCEQGKILYTKGNIKGKIATLVLEGARWQLVRRSLKALGRRAGVHRKLIAIEKDIGWGGRYLRIGSR